MEWNGRDFNSINGDYNICIVYLLGIVCCVVIFNNMAIKKEYTTRIYKYSFVQLKMELNEDAYR